MASVDAFVVNQHLRAFAAFLEVETGEPLRSLRTHPYLDHHESYKAVLSAVGRRRLRWRDWSEDDVGTGAIARSVVDAIEIRKGGDTPRNNLVPWEGRWGPESKPHSAIVDPGVPELGRAERALFDLYRDRVPDAESFGALVGVFGKQYALLGYLFFLKDWRRYAPVSTGAFDSVFRRLGVDLRMGGRASWENYAEYNGALAGVAALVSDLLGAETSALDAHSFLWTLEMSVCDMKREPSPEERAAASRLSAYAHERPKDRRATVDARIGQGDFRDQLVRRWGACAVTGCSNPVLLRASHVKPWAACDTREARDPDNGLLLSAGLDAAFDAGLVTFDDGGGLIVAAELSPEDAEAVGVPFAGGLQRRGLVGATYMEYHRQYVFRGSV